MTELVTVDLIQRISGDADRWQSPVAEACNAWDINTPERVEMFLATTAHESGGFRVLVENLKYSAAGLLRIWPTRFTEADAARMAYDEEAIAERAYGGRMGNEPEGSGDGYRYRGRGLIQVTGKGTYLQMGEHIGGDENGKPDPTLFVREPDDLTVELWAAYAAACYWDIHGCNEAADARDFERVTRIVNGGLNGLADREHWLDVVQSAMA